MKSSEFIRNLKEEASAGSTGTGTIAAIPNAKNKKKKSEVGSLFGGTYQQAPVSETGGTK